MAAWVGAVLGVAGSAFSGAGAYGALRMESQVQTFNARQLRVDATIAEQNAEEQARRLRMGGRRLFGQQSVAVARSGFRMEGTPLDVIAESMKNIELDAINTRRQGQFQAAQMRTQASWQEQLAKKSKSAGRLQLIGSGISGGAMAYSSFKN